MYYDATGDKAFLVDMWPTLTAQMDWFLAHVNRTTGLLLAREYTSFDDPLAYITLEGTALNAFFYHGLRDAAYIAQAVGSSAAAANYTALATALAAAMDTLLYDAASGTYSAGLMQGQALGPTPHAALLAIDRGVVPATRSANVTAWLRANYLNPSQQHCCNNPDWQHMVATRAGVSMTVTYYWVYKTLYGIDTAEADAAALDSMRAMWGPMVAGSNDTGTLYETFQDTESCHNYGAVPAYFLSAHVLGVRLAGPVWEQRLVVEPRLGGLPGAKGTVVTELGLVVVEWTAPSPTPPPLTGYWLNFTLSLPANAAHTDLRLPDVDVASVILNGQSAQATRDGRYAVVTVAPGNYTGAAKRV